MSSATQRDKESADPDCPKAGPNPATEKLFTALRDGLHAMAQPLTILRSAMEVLLRQEGSGIDHRRYLELSSKQVERTCHLLSSVRNLVVAQSIPAEPSHFELRGLLEPIVEAHSRALQDSGVAILTATQSPGQTVVGDAERTKQALSAALAAAAALCNRGDVIELLEAAHNGYVRLTLRAAHPQGGRIDSSHRLSLSLAEINMLSQRGHYEFAENPFRISLALPVWDPTPG